MCLWALGIAITLTNCTLWISQAGTAARAGNRIKGRGMRRLRSMEQSPPCAWEPVMHAKANANHTYSNKDGLQFKLVKNLTLQGWGDWLIGEWPSFLQVGACCSALQVTSYEYQRLGLCFRQCYHSIKKQLKPSLSFNFEQLNHQPQRFLGKH